MVLDILFIALFVSFAARGVHAVTRPGKLLSFLSVVPPLSRKIEALQAEKQELADLLWREQYRRQLGGTNEQDKEDLQREYDERRDALCCKYDLHIDALQEKSQKISKRLHWRVLLALAPALTECVVCMSSFWSVLVLLFWLFLPDCMLFAFVPLAAAGITVVSSKNQ